MVVKVPLHKLQPGMKLARPLYRGFTMLLAADCCLTEDRITRLYRWEVDQLAVYV